MSDRNIITIELGKRGGKPCIRRMRITLYDVLSCWRRALLPRIAEYQPTAPVDLLNLLHQTIAQAQIAHEASVASVREARRDFDI